MTQEIKYKKVKLPLTTLNYAECGTGKPLVIVPATISRITQWENLIQFMAQKFKVYFFELPGHGDSKAFKGNYSSALVAETVKDFLDELEIKSTSIMGFSFGGVLAMETLKLIENRVDNVLLISPCISKKALTFSFGQKFIINAIRLIARMKFTRKILYKLIHTKILIGFFVWITCRLAKTGFSSDFNKGLQDLKEKTLEIVGEQVREVMNLDAYKPKEKLSIPCYFTMSINDPLINYSVTLSALTQIFSNIKIKEFDFPFHQPRVPFTLKDYNENFYEFLAIIGQ